MFAVSHTTPRSTPEHGPTAPPRPQLLTLKLLAPRGSADIQVRTAASLLIAAEERARTVLEEMHIRARSLFESAASRGFSCGLELIVAELRALERAQTETLASAAEDLSRLVFQICENVIGETLNADPALLRRRVSEAIAGFEKPPGMVTLNPVDRTLFDSVPDTFPELQFSEEIAPHTARIEYGTFCVTIDAHEHLRRVEERVSAFLAQALASDLNTGAEA